MSKFNIGDKVRRKPEFLNALGWYWGDQMFEVIGFLNDFGAPEIQLSSESASPGSWAENRFELVAEEPEGEWVEIDREEYHSLVNGGSNGRLKISVETGPGALANRYHKWVPKLEWPTEPGSEFIYTYRDDPEQHRGFVLPYGNGDYAYTSFGGIVTDDARDHAMTLVEVISK